MKISVGMRIYISSSASVDLSAGDDIPKELLEKVPVIFRTTAVEYDKRRFMGNLRATNDLEISYSSSGIVIIKRGELIPDAVLDKVPDAFKTSGVIPPAPSVDKAKCYVDMDPEDFPGAGNIITSIGLSAIKYQTPGNNFSIDVSTKEIVINKEGYYNIEVVLNHRKGASQDIYSEAKIFKNDSIALGGGVASNINTNDWGSQVVKALGEHLVVGDRIIIRSNGRNSSSFWSTFSIEEI